MSKKDCWLRDDLEEAWNGLDPFERARTQQGEVYRELERRRTLRFCVEGRRYFLKRHQGAEWGEIFKNLLQLRLPVLSARNEWQALQALEGLSIDAPQVAAYGCRGWHPANLESFLVTDDLGEVESLEDLCGRWPRVPPASGFKRNLLDRVASIASHMHRHGICHRDLYICHFLRQRQAPHKLYLIDLHRALVKKRLARRWQVKDVAALYFSAMDIGLNRRDLFRFMRTYSGKPLRQTLAEDGGFWRQVARRAEKFRRREQRKAGA